MIDYLRMLWAEGLLFFNIGITIKIKITLKCNLHCPYCCIDIADGHRANYQELSTDEWIKIIENFPLKVRKVIVIGGEPFLRSDAPELINKLTAMRIIVKAESNGLYRRILDIKPTPYFKLIETFHHDMNSPQKAAWLFLHEEIKKRYRYLVTEIEYAELKGSQVMPLVEKGNEGCYYRRDFIFLPNGKLVLCIKDACDQIGPQDKIDWQYGELYSIYDVKEKFKMFFWNNIKSRIYKIIGKKMPAW